MQLKAFTDAAADAVARTLSNVTKEAERAEQLRQAEHRAFMAEQRETVSALIRTVEERLATVKDGKDGDRGEKGDEGPAGPKGDQGPGGLDGSNGADGRDGTDADMDALQRRLEELVAAIPAPQDGKDGADGKDAYAGEVKGVFSEEETYLARDIVKFDGSSWIAKTDEPGPIPGDGWVQLASKGKRGDRGEKGERGAEGKHGMNGAQPIALAIDSETMEFRMILDNGEECAADFYPIAKVIRGDNA